MERCLLPILLVVSGAACFAAEPPKSWHEEIPATGTDVAEAINLTIRKCRLHFQKPYHWQIRFYVKDFDDGKEKDYSPVIINSDQAQDSVTIMYWVKDLHDCSLERVNKVFHVFADGERAADVHYKDPFCGTSFDGAHYYSWSLLDSKTHHDFKLNKEYRLFTKVGPFASDKKGYEKPKGNVEEIAKHYRKARNYIALTIRFSDKPFREKDFIEQRRERTERKTETANQSDAGDA